MTAERNNVLLAAIGAANRGACLFGVAILLSVLLSSAVHAETLMRRVVKIADGDTITVLDSKRQYRIRLAGIDAPEKDQPFGCGLKETPVENYSR